MLLFVRVDSDALHRFFVRLFCLFGACDELLCIGHWPMPANVCIEVDKTHETECARVNGINETYIYFEWKPKEKKVKRRENKVQPSQRPIIKKCHVQIWV